MKFLNYSTRLHVGMTMEGLSNNFTTLYFSYNFIPCSLKFKCVKVQTITQSFPGWPRFRLGNPLICPKFQIHNSERPHLYFLTINIKLNFIWAFPLLWAIVHTACWQHTALFPSSLTAATGSVPQGAAWESSTLLKPHYLKTPKWSELLLSTYYK